MGGYQGYQLGNALENHLQHRQLNKGLKQLAVEDIGGNPTGSGENLDYSNDYARSFYEKYFARGGNWKGLNMIYADGSVPSDLVYSTYLYDGVHYIDSNEPGKLVGGFTRAFKNGKSDIYLSESAFSGKYKLYLTMGHELIHVKHNSMTGGLLAAKPNMSYVDIKIREWAVNYSEHSAYSWSVAQARAFARHPGAEAIGGLANSYSAKLLKYPTSNSFYDWEHLIRIIPLEVLYK